MSERPVRRAPGAATSADAGPSDHWPPTDFGLRHLAVVYERLFVDDEWAVRGEREFTWWLHDLPQVVRVGEPAVPPVAGCAPIARAWLSAETLIATGLDVDRAIPFVATLNAMATQSALVVDPVRAELRSCLRVALAEDDDDRLVLFRTAIALQAAEATHLGRVLDWPIARRPHPVNGERAVADDLLNVPAALGANTTDGELPPDTFAEIAGTGDEYGLWVAATHDETGLTAEMPWSGATPALALPSHLRTALFRMRTGERHPVIGRGVLVTLELPPLFDPVAAAWIANDLNQAERSSPAPVSSPGAWTARTVSAERTGIAWSSFIPAVELLRLEHPAIHLVNQACDARNRVAGVHAAWERAGIG